MSASKHTTGPLEVGYYRPTQAFASIREHIAVRSTDGTPVALFGANAGPTAGQSMADAVLFTAAQDLLDALGELVKIIDAAGLLNLADGVQLGQTVWYVKASDRMAAARAAIAKATPPAEGK